MSDSVVESIVVDKDIKIEINKIIDNLYGQDLRGQDSYGQGVKKIEDVEIEDDVESNCCCCISS